MTSSDYHNSLIWKRLDDEFSVDEAAELESALLDTPELQRELDEATELDALLGDAFSDPNLFGQDLQLKIIDSIAAKQQSNSFQETRRQPWYQMVAAIAAVILLIIAAQIQSGRSPQGLDQPQLAAKVQGQGIQVLREGQWQGIKAGESVYFDETIQNLSRDPVVFALHEGSRVTLRADSTMTLKQQDDVTVVDLSSELGGEVFCQVKHGQGRFKVFGHHVNVTVIGTKFNVRSFSNESFVGVVSGRVRVSSRGVNAGSMLLTARGFVRANNNQIVENGLCEAEKLTSWLSKPNSKAIEAVIKERPSESTKPAQPDSTAKPVDKPMQPPESVPNQSDAHDLDNPLEPPKTIKKQGK